MEAIAKNIIKVNLQLGGKTPTIVCNDTNNNETVLLVKNSRILNK